MVCRPVYELVIVVMGVMIVARVWVEEDWTTVNVEVMTTVVVEFMTPA